MKTKQTFFLVCVGLLSLAFVGCKDDDEDNNLHPTAAITVEGSDPYYMDEELSFSDASTDEDGTIVSWFWEFGDSETSTDQNPTHTYTDKAEYTVSLTVTDDQGASASATATVNIRDITDENIAPTASFTVTDTLILVGADVAFTNTSSDSDGTIDSYSWEFSDGTTSSDENPTYTFNEVGEFEVSLTITDDIGATSTYTSSIYVAGTVWSFPVGLKVESTAPAIDDNGIVYVTLSGKEGVSNIHAINTDGTQLWEKEVGDIVRSSPVISDDGTTIYTASYDDFMYALSATNGNTTWSHELGNNAKYSTAALGTDGSLYIGAQTDNVHALNADGTEKWTFATSGDVNGSPVIGSDGTVYIHSIDDYLYALDPETGEEEWSYFYGNWSGTALALGSDGTIYVSGEKDSETGVVAAVSSTGTELWSINTTVVSGSTTETGKIDQGGVAVGADGTVYVGTKGPELLALDPSDGSTKWSYTKTEFAGIGSTPAIDDRGFIYFGDDSGIFTVLDSDGNLVFEMSLGTKIWSSATIGDDGMVYIGASQEDDSAIFYAINFHAGGAADSSWPMRHGNRRHTGRL